MNLSMLDGMKTESLQAIQEHITKLMAARFDTSIRRGRTATFMDSRGGITRTIRIDQVNRITVSATEISPEAGKRWKVGLQSVKVVPIERGMAHVVAKPAGPHVPTSFVKGSVW